ncbi:hypothetical protein HYC85_014174 [Camellia sinensis]|uniref:Biotin carboxyl carrier protein of acetyl-CoA carboxylase n=1 Tax=Camellia sinensis TaxID=4442 RepID=A0A7J7H6Q8_CAMSI|nr:hypothetical protein HYC85_014174 [Camellia sinensis]
MASSSSIAATASVASVSKTNLPHPQSYHSHSKLFFRLSPRPKLRFSTKGLQSSWNRSNVIKAQSNEVNFQWLLSMNPQTLHLLQPNQKYQQQNPRMLSHQVSLLLQLASEESISEFISQVANLVKSDIFPGFAGLVDSRDIVELQLKQFDCELLIRKKEAMPQPTSSAPVDIMHSPPSPAAAPPTFQLPPSMAAPSAPTPSAPSVSPSPPAAKSAKSSLPPLKCPMAGTFYRSPAPGEPPLVKVGDKVQKGQVLCIIEAMKLMNEIEADQSGTVVEISAEDGKPVSVDTPLFVIEP